MEQVHYEYVQVQEPLQQRLTCEMLLHVPLHRPLKTHQSINAKLHCLGPFFVEQRATPLVLYYIRYIFILKQRYSRYLGKSNFFLKIQSQERLFTRALIIVSIKTGYFLENELHLAAFIWHS